MGCSTSKLDNKEAVQLCKDRKRLIKQAVEQRARFASAHIAYIQSLKKVSAALHEYIEGDEPHDFLISERHQLPETVRVEALTPSMQYNFGFDGIFPMQSSPMHPSSFFFYSPNRSSTNIPPLSPEISQWEFFWNPFSSLDNYGYSNGASLEQMVMDYDVGRLRQIREEEGIPELEDIELDESDIKMYNAPHERAKVHMDCNRDEVIIENFNADDEEEEGVEEEEEGEGEDKEEEEVTGIDYETRGLLQSRGRRTSIETLQSQMVRQVAASNQKMAVGEQGAKDAMLGFTVTVNRRPFSMAEVIKELDDQFMAVCTVANEVSAMLAGNKAWYSSPFSELTVKKILNPAAMIHLASSRSSSSRFIVNSSSFSKEEGEESSINFSEECMFSARHQSTLDQLYAWEKKLCNEVRCGERIRIAYEKKCMQLRNHDVKGDDPSVEKMKDVLRDLHTQIKVSMYSVEAICKRVETLRDEELQPQLLELVKGLARMWKVMAECHQSQKRTLDDAKLLLAGTLSKLDAKKQSFMSVSKPQSVSCSAANLESQLKNWRACFNSWITSQRSYVHALYAWLQRCVCSDPDISKISFSPRQSSRALPIFGLCIQWFKSLDATKKAHVLDGLDFFAAGMGSLSAQQQKEDSKRYSIGISKEGRVNGVEVVEVGREVQDDMTAEKMAEVAIRLLCARMSVAMSSLTEFSVSSAKRYAELVSQWESAKWPRDSGGAGVKVGMRGTSKRKKRKK